MKLLPSPSLLFGSLLLLLPDGGSIVNGYEYELISAGEIGLADITTGIVDLQSIFLGDDTKVICKEVEWNHTGNLEGSSTLYYATYVNGNLETSGSHDYSDTENPPTEIDAGIINVAQRGSTDILVKLFIDSSSAATTANYQAYKAGVSLIPLFVILVFAFTTKMVEFSLFFGVFVGACIVAGNVNEGFKTTLDTYILNALADEDHVYVILFTLFLSGMVGMMQKSGGLIGFTEQISKISKTPRLAMFACFLVGVFIFFDDYTNVLLAGATMRPLLDSLSVSREKLSFIVDGTSAPIASIAPISSWVGFEVGLIGDQLEIIMKREEAAGEELTIKDSAFAIFLQSIKYRYYPIYMLVLMMLIIFAQRDFGPMLVYERIARVYALTDGGPNRGKATEMEGKEENQPRKDQPLKGYNMYLPVLLLIGLVFYLLVATGTVEGEEQTFMEKIENSNSFSALLWATMASAIITLIFYCFQFTREGTFKLYLPTLRLLRDMLPSFCKKCKGESTEPKPRTLMNVRESVEAFLFGMSRIFMALIVLTLAWASGAVMTAVGADRLFAGWIMNGIPPEWLPTISFIVAFFMALATGTSWGTMSILFPLILVPTYYASDKDEVIFYAVTAGILSGSVAGDHVSPISDTTVMSSLACDIQLLAHVRTQAPYALIIIIISIVLGTIPIGFKGMPNIVIYILGWIVTVAFVYGICKPIMSTTGAWDVFNWIMMKLSPDPRLNELAEDTVRAATSGEDLSCEYKSKHWETEDTQYTLAESKSAFHKIVDEDEVSTPEKDKAGANENEMEDVHDTTEKDVTEKDTTEKDTTEREVEC